MTAQQEHQGLVISALRAIFALELHIGLVEVLSPLHLSLRLSIPNPTSFLSPFPGIITVWRLSVPNPTFVPFCFSQILPPNKPLAFLTLSQGLLTPGPQLIQIIWSISSKFNTTKPNTANYKVSFGKNLFITSTTLHGGLQGEWQHRFIYLMSIMILSRNERKAS